MSGTKKETGIFAMPQPQTETAEVKESQVTFFESGLFGAGYDLSCPMGCKFSANPSDYSFHVMSVEEANLPMLCPHYDEDDPDGEKTCYPLTLTRSGWISGTLADGTTFVGQIHITVRDEVSVADLIALVPHR